MNTDGMDGITGGKGALNGWMQSRMEQVDAAMEYGQEARTPEENEEAAKAFEGFFNTMLVKEMRKSLPKGFFQGAGSDVYAAWFDEHLSGALTKRDALGIGRLIESSLNRASSVQDTADLEQTDGSPQVFDLPDNSDAQPLGDGSQQVFDLPDESEPRPLSDPPEVMDL